MNFSLLQALKEREHTVNESILEANVKALVVQQEKEIENLRSQLLERVRIKGYSPTNIYIR